MLVPKPACLLAKPTKKTAPDQKTHSYGSNIQHTRIDTIPIAKNTRKQAAYHQFGTAEVGTSTIRKSRVLRNMKEKHTFWIPFH